MFESIERSCELIIRNLGIQNSDLDEVAEVMFPVGECPFELIICFLKVLKCVIDDVEALFEGDGRACEHILCILGIQKSGMDEFAELMIQVGEWPREIIIRILDVLKCDFGEVVEALFEDVETPSELIFCILGIQKSDLDEVVEVLFPSSRLKNDFRVVDKAMFLGLKGHANSFSASWAFKKATWTKSQK
jgi:hypothetical protein